MPFIQILLRRTSFTPKHYMKFRPKRILKTVRDFSIFRIDKKSVIVTHSIIRRFLAAFFDFGIFGIYVLFIGVVREPAPEGLKAIMGHVNFIAYMLYFFLPELLWGQTLGKFIFDLKVIIPNPKRNPLIAILLRNIVKFFETLPFFLPIWMIALTKQNQRIGDFVAGTLVVRKSFLSGKKDAIIPQRPKKSKCILVATVTSVLALLACILFLIFLILKDIIDKGFIKFNF